jgi:N-succinyldiaminopimelate aminotransferase
MNPDLARLQAYPFDKLHKLKANILPPRDKPHISLAVGEPKHAAPGFLVEAVITHLPGLSSYPATRGTDNLRQAMAGWLIQRFKLAPASLDPERHVLPVNGTREALFAFAQCVIDRGTRPVVVMPNPFYQIYEGAAILAGAEPYYVNCRDETGLPDFDAVSPEVWERCRLVYICSPGNPTGAVMGLEVLQRLIERAERYDFVIASDECYSEIYPDEADPPAGLLQAAHALGNGEFRRCIVFHSLSKRSNVPGLRSGFVAGDAAIIREFLLYRTYHGCAMPPHTQAASALAWQDEQHVTQNRALYREKFAAVLEVLAPVLDLKAPAGGFYLWPEVPGTGETFTRELYTQQNITVLPGSFLARTAEGVNPATRRVRIALVPLLEECVEAAWRIRSFVTGS